VGVTYRGVGNSDGEPLRSAIPSTSRRFTTPGAEAADRWLFALGLPAPARWHVEIAVLADAGTRFDLNIYAEEWGFCFQHAGRSSWVRVTDAAFVHGRDDHDLLAKAPDLLAISVLLADLEHEHGLAFRRATASVRTNIPDAPNIVRDWLIQPLPFSTARWK
jgi:hypothetical protein